MSDPHGDIVTTREAAARLHVSTAAVCAAIRRQLLRARPATPLEAAMLVDLGRRSGSSGGRLYVIDLAELERYLRARRPVGRPRKA